MKRCKIRIEHSTYPPFKLQIRPDTRVSDVLAYLNLPKEDYIIYPVSNPARTLYPEENLYGVIESDAKLIATFSTKEADAYIRSFFNEEEEPYEESLY